jgi:WD40 repeat protein
MKPKSAQTALWDTCKTIPTCVLDDPAAGIDVNQPPAQPPRRSTNRPLPSLIRQCTVDSADGSRVDHPEYQLQGKIGQGAGGVVYAASQNTLDREVAIKVIHPEMAGDELVRSLFFTEAVVTGDLDHPNIVPIYDLGMDQHRNLFYAMKRIKGRSWSTVIGQQTEEENIDVLLRVCDAIAFSHDKGVVHRDLKPQNVMLGDYGEVFVMDWGIAASPSGSGKAEVLTPTSSQAGTPVYMAPEMAESDASQVNHLSDIYLLGGILYQIETGLTPHRAGNLRECLRKVADNIIQPTDKQSELIDIALKAMATDPARRYQSVAAFSQAIRDYQSHAQSIELCRHAADIHRGAQGSRTYRDYQMALFSYENALRMWPENGQAAAGKIGVNRDYAGAAFANKDYDLAISLLDGGNDSHQALLKKVLTAKQQRQARQRHLRWFKIASLSLTLAILVIVTTGLAIVKRQKDRAVAAEKRMRIAQTEALQEYYYSAIALASRKVGDQLTAQAEVLLDKLPEHLRGWEWGRLARQCQLDLFTFRGHDQPIAAVAFSPDERYVATADRGGTVKLWNRESGQEVRTYSGVSGTIDALRFSTDNRQLSAVAASGLMFSWDVHTGAMDRAGYGGKNGDALLFQSPDNMFFIKRTLENTVLIQAADSNQPVCRLEGHTGTVYTASFSNDGGRVVTGSADKQAIVWEIPSGRPLIRLQGHSGSVLAVQFSPSGRYILTGSADTTVKLWSATRERNQIHLAGHDSFVSGVAFSPDSRRLATSSHDGTVRVWDLSDRKAEKTLVGHHSRVHAVKFSPDGRFLISGAADNRAILWQVETGDVISVLSGHTHSITCVDVSPDGTVAATGSWDRTIKLWDLNGFQEKTTLKGHQEAVTALDFSPDGRWLVSGGKDQVARLWNLDTGQTERVLSSHAASIYSVAFSRDSQRIATAGWDKTIKIWDVLTGRLLQTLTGHTGSLYATRFADNGRRVISAGWDQSVKVWDTHSGQELLELRGHSAPVVALDVSLDGRMVATGGHDRTVVVWKADGYSGTPAAHNPTEG